MIFALTQAQRPGVHPRPSFRRAGGAFVQYFGLVVGVAVLARRPTPLALRLRLPRGGWRAGEESEPGRREGYERGLSMTISGGRATRATLGWYENERRRPRPAGLTEKGTTTMTTTQKLLDSNDLPFDRAGRADYAHLRGYVRATPDAPCTHVDVFVVNNEVLEADGFGAALLVATVPGTEACGEEFFAAIAESFLRYPLTLTALVSGWWSEPLADFDAVLRPSTAYCDLPEVRALFFGAGEIR